MKQCAEDMELKLQGNKQSVVYSGIKNIVKTSSGEKHWQIDKNIPKWGRRGFWRAERCWFLGTTESRRCWSGSDRQTDVLRYVSEERCLALRLCGWISRGNDLDVEIFLRTLEQEREWERAAAVALFNLDIRRAIQILNKGATAEKGEESYRKLLLEVAKKKKKSAVFTRQAYPSWLQAPEDNKWVK